MQSLHRDPVFAVATRFFCVLMTLVCWTAWIGASPVLAGERGVVRIEVSDALARSAQPVRVEARVSQQGLLAAQGVGGERLTLEVDGTEVASGLTGGDGRVFFEFEARQLGLFPLTVILKDSPRVRDAEGVATLAVWERRRPLLLIEQAVVLADGAGEKRAKAEGRAEEGPDSGDSPERRLFGDASPGAAEALSRLTKFYFHPVYLLPAKTLPQALWSGVSGGSTVSHQFHRWLKTQGFPPGVVLTVAPTAEGIETFIEQLKAEGWENVKAGAGATPLFAEALVAQRIKVAIRTDRPREEFPRRAKVVQDWVGVRRQLQD